MYALKSTLLSSTVFITLLSTASLLTYANDQTPSTKTEVTAQNEAGQLAEKGGKSTEAATPSNKIKSDTSWMKENPPKEQLTLSEKLAKSQEAYRQRKLAQAQGTAPVPAWRKRLEEAKKAQEAQKAGSPAAAEVKKDETPKAVESKKIEAPKAAEPSHAKQDTHATKHEAATEKMPTMSPTQKHIMEKQSTEEAHEKAHTPSTTHAEHAKPTPKAHDEPTKPTVKEDEHAQVSPIPTPPKGPPSAPKHKPLTKEEMLARGKAAKPAVNPPSTASKSDTTGGSKDTSTEKPKLSFLEELQQRRAKTPAHDE